MTRKPKATGKFLDVGCGTACREDHIGIDRTPFKGVDIVRDIMRGLPFDDSSVDRIHCQHVIEHCAGEDLIFLVEEFYRVTKPGGVWTIICPSINSPKRYRNPNNKTRDWTYDSFMFWEVDGNGDYLIDSETTAKLSVQAEELSNLDMFYQMRALK